MPAVTPIRSDGDEEFVEVDPTRRFSRFDDLLRQDDFRKIYRAFDVEYGREVAWVQVRLANFSNDSVLIDRLHENVKLFSTLKSRYIISCFGFWTDEERNMLNIITEVNTWASMREYRMRHPDVSIHAIKKWSKQILYGLEYFHTHEPCIIHRHISCSDISIDACTGQVKIFGLDVATVVGGSHEAHSVLGTPAYMAPEMYKENYTEKVDIYAFGMCLLEMVTRKIPYSECDSNSEIYKKVSTGVQPQALSTMADPEVKALIEKCINAQPRARPSATDLLSDAFFSELDNSGSPSSD